MNDNCLKESFTTLCKKSSCVRQRNSFVLDLDLYIFRYPKNFLENLNFSPTTSVRLLQAELVFLLWPAGV